MKLFSEILAFAMIVGIFFFEHCLIVFGQISVSKKIAILISNVFKNLEIKGKKSQGEKIIWISSPWISIALRKPVPVEVDSNIL